MKEIDTSYKICKNTSAFGKKNRRKRGLKRLGIIGGLGIATVLLLVVIYGISWIVTCGIIKLITMCFGWTFSWKMATGIWLVICILRSIFKSNTTVNNYK